MHGIDPKSNDARILQTIVHRHPIISPLMARWPVMDLPDCWLSGSALAQSIWNAAFDLPPDHGLDDLDIVYFDAADPSETGERDHAARIVRYFGDLPLRLDVKNQARVHLWYDARFGYPIAPYRSAAQAIATFPTTSAAVGIRADASARLEIVAPHGLSDLLEPVVRANKVQITQTIYEEKIIRWQRLWPDLAIIPWNDD